jgi:hypothetical protein
LAKKQAPLVIVDPTVQFSTTTDTLAKVLAQAVRFTGQFGELPKGSVRVEAHDDGTVTAIGMSMDSAILIRFDAKVETPGVVVLPAALAAPMLKALPDSKVTVTVDTSLTAHFEAAVSSRFSLRCWAGDAAVPFRFGFEVRQELNAEEATRFSDAVAFAETAASTDDSARCSPASSSTTSTSWPPTAIASPPPTPTSPSRRCCAPPRCCVKRSSWAPSLPSERPTKAVAAPSCSPCPARRRSPTVSSTDASSKATSRTGRG